MRILADEHLAVKYAPRSVIQHALVILMRRTIRHRMVDDRVRIAVLRAAQHIESVDPSLTALGCEFQIDIMPREGAAEIDTSRIIPASSAQGDLADSVMERFSRFFLHAIVR